MRDSRDSAEEMAARTVREIQALLQTDEQWTQWVDTGFNWWPHWFEQRVRFEPSWLSRGIQVSRVVVETIVARNPGRPLPDELLDLMVNVPGNGERSALTGSWHPYAIVPAMSALIQRDGLVRLRSSVIVHDETEDWLRKVIAFAAVEQLGAASCGAITYKNGFSLELANSVHPTSGARANPDEMVNAAVIRSEQLLQATGSSKWTDLDEFRTTAEQLTERGLVATTDEGVGDHRGLTFEAPTGPNPGFAIEGKNSSLVQVFTNVIHARLGAGLLIILRPFATRLSNAPASHLSAMEANLAECGDSADMWSLGSWGGTGAGLAYVSFLPDALYRRGGLVLMCWNAATRAVWFDKVFGVPEPKKRWSVH